MVGYVLLVPLALMKLLQGADVAGLFGPGKSRQILEGAEQAGRKALSMIHLDRAFLSLAASAANVINWGFLLAIVIGLLLSLYPRRARTS